MTKPLEPVVEAKAIAITADLTIHTTVDPETSIHHIACGICKRDITLTVTGHPSAFFKHRKKCLKETEGKKKDSFRHYVGISSLSTVIPVNNPSHITVPSISNNSPSPHIYPISMAAQSVANTISPSCQPCPGYTIPWSAGSIWRTYPYHQHATRDLHWYPASFDPLANSITIRSLKCLQNLSADSSESACASCIMIPHSAEFRALKERAESSSLSPFMPFQYLTYQQQEIYMRNMSEKLKKYRSKFELAIKRIDTSYRDDFDLPMSEDPIMVEHITQKRGRKPTVSKVEPETKRKRG